jgi:hypothetical protein
MRATRTEFVTLRFTPETLARLEATAERLGMTRSALCMALVEAGTARVLDSAWSCRTVHVEGRAVHSRGSADALPGAGLRTELVAPQVFWDWLDRVEDL